MFFNFRSSDVVHDFLAFLAEQMTELNKQKQLEMKGFLDWLRVTLRVRPDSGGNAGIESLTGKMALLNYLGDYQKNESALSLDDLLGILRKNKQRIEANVSGREVIEQIGKEYTASLEKLRTIKERLRKTDSLIDQIVYRLYGLTTEEMNQVEMSCG